MPLENEGKASLAQDSGSESIHNFIVSISSSNTPLGKCLEEALVSLKMSNSTEDTIRQKFEDSGVGSEGEAEKCNPAHYVDSDAIQSIRQAFGGSIARSQTRESRKLSIGSPNDSLLCSKVKSCEDAPGSLLYGRLDHYNRVGQNWRLVIDNIRITERYPIFHERAAKRRRRSFWHSNSPPCEGGKEQSRNVQNPERLIFSDYVEIQILGYNDI